MRFFQPSHGAHEGMESMTKVAVIGLLLALSVVGIGGCAVDDSDSVESSETTTLPPGADVQRAALTGEPEASALAAPGGTLAGCPSGVEIQPVPPFFAAGIGANGLPTTATANTANTDGTFVAEASVIGYWGEGDAWVSALNTPPFGAGTTTVSTTVNFTSISAELVLWALGVGSSSGAVGLTIELRDGGVGGPLLGSCRMSLLDKSIPFGYLHENVPRSVSHSCTIHHGAVSGFLVSKVSIDASASTFPYSGFAVARATGNVETIRHSTCLDSPPLPPPLCPPNRPRCCETDDNGECLQCIGPGQQCN